MTDAALLELPACFAVLANAAFRHRGVQDEVQKHRGVALILSNCQVWDPQAFVKALLADKQQLDHVAQFHLSNLLDSWNSKYEGMLRLCV